VSHCATLRRLKRKILLKRQLILKRELLHDTRGGLITGALEETWD
jgi:hypothetical protein